MDLLRVAIGFIAVTCVLGITANMVLEWIVRRSNRALVQAIIDYHRAERENLAFRLRLNKALGEV